MTNARDAITEALIERGWREGSTLSINIGRALQLESWLNYMPQDGPQRLTIRYRLYGSLGSKRMMDWYGKDTTDPHYINWGVESAEISHYVGGEEIWKTDGVFSGKNKKIQVLAWIKES